MYILYYTVYIMQGGTLLDPSENICSSKCKRNTKNILFCMLVTLGRLQVISLVQIALIVNRLEPRG